jgi:membrane dipeptidase
MLKFLIAGAMLALPAAAHADAMDTARAALKAAPIIDGHNDLPHALKEQNGSRTSDFDFRSLPERFKGKIVTDFTMLREGGVGGQFWSVYVPADLKGADAVQKTLEQIDIMQRLIDANPSMLVKVGTADEAERAMKTGKIASMFGAEGGHSINNSLAVLRQLYALGVRYMTLTHANTTDWADSATDAPKHDGLTPFGVEVVKEMNRLGMLVDLSHVTPATMMDALDASEAPVIFSHSGSKAVQDVPRNVPDAVLKRLPENGGVIMVYFAEGYTSKAVNDWQRERAAEEGRLKHDYPDRPGRAKDELAAWEKAHPMPKATVTDIADHIDHIREVAGIDHIGIGGDFDGLSTYPTGLETVAGYPNLFAELARRGYSKADLMKISSGNILRAWRQAETVAKRLQKERRPSEAVFYEEKAPAAE